MSYSNEIIFNSKFEEIEKLEGFLNTLQTDLSFDDEAYAKMMLVVSEAVTNGIMHGNQQDASKKVTMNVISSGGKITFTVTDEGDGFDPTSLPNPLEEENLLLASGRGVFLMEEYADEAVYSNNGSTLTLSFSI